MLRKRNSLAKFVTFQDEEEPNPPNLDDVDVNDEEKLLLEDLRPPKRLGSSADKYALNRRGKAKFGNQWFTWKTLPNDPTWLTVLEYLAIFTAITLAISAFYYFEHMHFHVARGYAYIGHAPAQHVVGQRLLTGKGTNKNEDEAMKYFQAAADQGHAEASFNLAVGHMHGHKTNLRKGDVVKLLHHAKKNGVEGADHALNLCGRRGCDI